MSPLKEKWYRRKMRLKGLRMGKEMSRLGLDIVLRHLLNKEINHE